ncbi:MAG TPA: chemotaxis protein CheW [Clostridia bacterium]|nr:chemotaxis protein CheW [Clostridia bacterium]
MGNQEQQLVVFELEEQKYAIPILEIQEIIRMVNITPVPKTDSFLEGVVNLRGNIIPVVNLRKRLGMRDKEHDNETRIIVVEFNEENLGVIVDKVLEVGRYSESEVEPPHVAGKNVEFLRGVIKKDKDLWLLFNLEKLL